ncbi:hypothetical protein K4F52_000372 [Lecanicillium sp. MT-2017a]|nr:hypothetical protein K4F52_000372 [Lecanicillium sp. MT-2017a]
MVKVVPYFAGLLALCQGAVATKAVTSFSEWVDGILEDPNGNHMKPEEVVAAFQSGQFNSPTPAKAGRSLLEKRATCYEHPGTECLIVDAVACINAVARRPADQCRGIYLQCQINTAAMTTDGRTDSSW